MTDDLTARLTGALDALEDRERATRADATELAALHRDVRRRRVTRTAQHASVAAVTVVAVATAGWFGLQRTHVEPVVTPSPSRTTTTTPTPPPTPSPTPTPSATPVTAPTPVTVPGMPPMFALDDAVLASVGPGWAVGLYTNGYGDPFVVDGRLLPTALVVAAPTGELYLGRVREDGAWLEPVRWDGSSSVVVEHLSAQDTARYVVDLRTGDLTPDGRGLPADAWFLAEAPDGGEVWSLSDSASATSDWWVVPPTGAARQVATGSTGFVHEARLSPDGARLALGERGGAGGAVVVELASGRTVPGGPVPDGQACRPAGWADATHVLLLCADDGAALDPPRPDQRPRLVRQDVTGRSATVVVRELAGDTAAPSHVHPVGDGRLVAALAPVTADGERCADDDVVELRADGSTTPLDRRRVAPDAPVGIGHVLTGYVQVTEGVSCGGDEAPAALVVVDLVGGGSWALPAGDGPEARYPVASAVVPRR
ncbi:hypothetical protein [Cellulomonas shaoxiangyii]|uniref:WD40 repeat domain-containing protein n=1 Tax=Cellulomonas shaoxiangyii TaxID=2566013 RepID=A0A4P7SMN6_9CELL|nr:hypothetical protein [Cellulomonas shaoxiangyii]QCB95048.1 hypothetical protein E5225_17240 [Cellulomonas shaoxiangyii]TGY86377.1 hypothetical protein E5226_02325 [Cellulomonas shaoxiangyii]